jgi:nicotinamide riboside kinase
MVCKVKIIEDSLNPHNDIRLTTFELKYWRGFHSELMTHRMFSRNASSSRAIPINTFLKQVWNDPAGPIHWGANQAGMKAREELTGFKRWFAKKTWSLSGKIMCGIVWLVNKVANPHKQTFNRLLEPWQYISVIVSATDWDNFFELRDHPDAQPEIRELAHDMKILYGNNKPVIRENHLPYVTPQERKEYDLKTCMKYSTARCARVSYLTHDGKQPNHIKDLELYKALVGSVPIHASPTEHPATALKPEIYYKNFRGWKQHRVDVEKTINNLKQK